MNKQIELILMKTIQDTGMNDMNEIYETFAENIVKGCIEVASNQRNPTTLNYKPSEQFVEDLKRHFGVKE